MYLKIKEIDKNLFYNALAFFDKKTIKNIKNKASFKESIVARYLISNSPGYNINLFSSISHKDNLVFIGLNDKKVGIDIEIIRERDKSLLNIISENESKLIGGKSWENFYHIWTAKESIIKYEGLMLDDADKISLIKHKNKKNKISDIEFSKEMRFNYLEKKYKVYSGKKDNKIYSIIY